MEYRSEKDFLLDAVAFQDGSLEPSRLVEFEEALRSSAELRASFIRLQLRSFQCGEIQRGLALQPKPVRRSPSLATGNSKRWVKFLWPAMAVACVVLIALFGRIPVEEQGTGIEITHDRLAVWDGETPGNGKNLVPGTSYTLQAGAIRMDMPGGAVVSIAAPATFVVQSGDTLELIEGRIAARLPTEESRLTVLSDGMKVTDLGTAFGVLASPGGQSVVSVFEGKVRLDSLVNQLEETMTLPAGVSVVADGFAPIPVDQEIFDSSQYRDLWSLTAGIDEASTLIEFVPPGPLTHLEAFRDDHRLFILPERLGVRLEQPIEMDLRPATRSRANNPSPSLTLPAGTLVKSYLFFFKPQAFSRARVHSLSGSIAFSKPVLGIITDSGKLQETDAVFGIPSLNYERPKNRGLEGAPVLVKKISPDIIRFSDNGRAISFHLNVGRAEDHFRVLVAAD